MNPFFDHTSSGKCWFSVDSNLAAPLATRSTCSFPSMSACPEIQCTDTIVLLFADAGNSRECVELFCGTLLVSQTSSVYS